MDFIKSRRRWSLLVLFGIACLTIFHFGSTAKAILRWRISLNNLRGDYLNCGVLNLHKWNVADLLKIMGDRIHSIPGTTGSGIPAKIRAVLRESYGGVNESATDFYGAATAVTKLERDCGWNSNKSNFDHSDCITQFQFKRNTDKWSIEDYHNDIDIVIPSIRDLDFLNEWKPFFEGFHLIIIQDGDPAKVLKIPVWADYELYNRWDIDKILGASRKWIISSRDASIRNFGFLVSRKKFIYTIDDDCLPAKDTKGQLINALSTHIRNLVTNSTPFFFNTLYDPYREGSDFVRGYPYSMRIGVPTAISHGIWLNAPDYDAPTQLLKVDERNLNLADITVTVPHGILYPMCSMNVAFNRELIGPAFMQGLMGDGMPWGRYDDMFAGWASKVVADHLGYGVKTGSPYIRHNKASNPFTNLKKEYIGLFWQEELIVFFQNVRFSPKAVTSQDCYLELVQMIRTNLTCLNEYFVRLANAMELWVGVWNDAQPNGKLKFTPSRQNQPSNRVRAAVMTICRNEKIFLSIWLKYYRRYFTDNDVYILDNDSDDGSTQNLTVNVLRVHSQKYFDHQWLVDIVRNMTQYLLDKGYKYVLFTEIDEIVVPDPNKYPSGLVEYINRFHGNASRTYGFNLIHNPDKEAPIDLNRPILAQRSYWRHSPGYSKPLLTTTALHWGVGFHTCTETVLRDDNLKLFHISIMDRGMFLKRAEWKSKQNFKIDDIKKGLGAHNILTGKNALDAYGAEHTTSEIPEMFRNPPIF
ncbi:unnamed protein product [Adineta steineri]|uniref:Uncharacterized protein n=1 Tax=Adineta steineri TaxID=433720 RepID=A0A815NXE1_9BILA|nr:unnamed protein product [Adineta steineri]CAF4148775.1 unnamed protein product [Adineta steineri]